jgi:hypothetical protein
MSKFNFLQAAARIESVMRPTLMEMAEASRDEFVGNFDRQGFDGIPWEELLARDEPPPKLIVTGQLRQKTQDSIKEVTDKRAVLENESIDDRGRSYAAYHNDGTSRMVARPFMWQTDKLTKKHLRILEINTGKAWRLA